MPLEPQTVSIAKIYLDQENPRHETLPDEPSIIRHLLANEKVRALAKDIAEAGSTSPLELVALVKHPKIQKSAFVVVEGNRRICALKLLADPDKAGSEKDRRYFSNLAANMPHLVTKVQAIVFDSREQATRWFSLRHRGEQDGVGTVAWNANQISRFALRTTGKDPNAQAAKLIEYAKTQRLLSSQDISSLNITTITRYLSNPLLRNALGLNDRNGIEIRVPDAEFHRALTRFLSDSLSPGTSGVSSRTFARDREDYANRLIREGIAATGHGGNARLPGTSTSAEIKAGKPSAFPAPPLVSASTVDGGPSEVAGGEARAGRDSRNPDRRSRVVPTNFTARIKDKSLNRLYKELKTIDATQFTFAATALLRSVLEKSTALYLTAKGVTPSQKLNEKLKQLSVQLAEDGMKDRELKFLRCIASNGRDDPWSPDSLGHFIHGGAVPTPSYVFRYWDNIESVLRKTLNAS